MGNEVPTNVPAVPAQPEAPKAERGFFETMFDETVVGPMLEQLIEKDPDAAKEYFSLGRDYVKEDGQIDRQAFLKETTLNEKMWAMVSLWLANTCPDKISEKLNADGNVLHFEDFDEIKAGLDNKTAELKDNNIIFSPQSYFSELFKNLGKPQLAKQQKLEVKLPKKSTLVIPKISNFIGFSAWKILAKKEGVNLKIYSYDEMIPEPGEDEVQIVMLDPALLPTSEKPVYDQKMLDKCKTIYGRGRSIWIDPFLVEAIKNPQTLPVAQAAPAAAPAVAPTAAVPAAQQTVQSQVAQATAPVVTTPAAPGANLTNNPAPASTQAPAQKAA